MTDARIGPAEAARLTLDAVARGDAVVVVTLLASTAPGAARPGDRRLIYEDGSTAGSLGDPALDAAADAVARESATAQPAAHELAVGSHSARVFVEAHRPPDELVIVGAGHIAVPLARLGALLGFRLTVLDDREEFADEARFPEGARVLRADFTDPFRAVRLGRRSYVVLVTRAHKYDFDCLSHLLAAGSESADRPRYTGMIGSRRRVRAAFEALLQAGHSREELATIHAPIGLDIGAETPEEIAVSIGAEIIHVRSGHQGSTAPRAELERVATRLLPEE